MYISHHSILIYYRNTSESYSELGNCCQRLLYQYNLSPPNEHHNNFITSIPSVILNTWQLEWLQNNMMKLSHIKPKIAERIRFYWKQRFLFFIYFWSKLRLCTLMILNLHGKCKLLKTWIVKEEIFIPIKYPKILIHRHSFRPCNITTSIREIVKCTFTFWIFIRIITNYRTCANATQVREPLF